MIRENILSALSKFREKYQLTETKFHGVCFDMDGVLYDSMPAHCRSWLETASEFSLIMSEEDCYMFEGQTGSYTINLLYERTYQRPASKDERKAVYQRKTELFQKYNTGALIPNIKEVLERFAPLKRVVVTGSSQKALLGKLEHNFPNTFSQELIVTGLDVQIGKPNPEPYLMGMTKGQLLPQETIVIENAPKGVRSASSAGCFTIAINTGPLDNSILLNEGADIVLDDMQTLLDHIELFIK